MEHDKADVIKDIESDFELLQHTLAQCKGTPNDWRDEQAVVSLLVRITSRIEASYGKLEEAEMEGLWGVLKRVTGMISCTDDNQCDEYLTLTFKMFEELDKDVLAYPSLSDYKVRYESLHDDLQTKFVSTENSVSEKSAEDSSQSTKILIVEDNLVNRKVLGGMLRSYGTCDYATDGSEGLFQFLIALEEETPYSLIFLDILMPNMDGRQLLRIIRSYEKERGITGLDGVKVVMTTCLDDSTNILGSFREGCEAYLTKPILRDKFEEVLSKFLNQNESSTA